MKLQNYPLVYGLTNTRYEGMEAHARTGDVRLRKYGFQN